MSLPLVSICCVTYNHANYISQAIESFLMQRGDFEIEIIIGEDCSTDNTRDIIDGYINEHPGKIRLITSKQNVGAQQNFHRVLTAARGDYIAICDGDDYWIDSDSIAKKISTLVANSHIDICFTAAYAEDEHGVRKKICDYGNKVKFFSLEDVVKGSGGFMPTASLFLRGSVIQRLPEWFVAAPVGDYYLQICASINNGVVYLPDATCVYRVNVIHSWSYNIKNKASSEKILSSLAKHEECLNSLMLLDIDSGYINHAIANELSIASRLLLLNGFHDQYVQCITKSWHHSRYVSKSQFLLYFFRYFPGALSLILNKLF